VLDERGLHGVKVVGLADAFNGGDLVALMHDGEGQAAVHAAAVDVHRACAALAVIAALFGAGEVDALAEGIEQGGADVEIPQNVILAVDAEGHIGGAGARGRSFILSGRVDVGRGMHERRGAGEEAGGAQS
jgi:hypothetical protein